MTPVRTRIGVALAAGSLILAGCSSSGGSDSAPSLSQLTSKLEKDSNISALKAQLPSAARSKFPAIVQCVAKALQKDADKSDLRDYVNGKKSLDDLSGNQAKAEDDAKNCVTSVVKSG